MPDEYTFRDTTDGQIKPGASPRYPRRTGAGFVTTSTGQFSYRDTDGRFKTRENQATTERVNGVFTTILPSSIGPLVTSYQTNVVAAGGTVSSPALTALNTFLYSTYAGLTVASFSAKFGFLWAPLSNFNGMLVPVIGSNFTNNNFLSGDYNIQTGLTGNGVFKHLDTGYVLPSGSRDSNSFGVRTTPILSASANTGFMGSRTGVGTEQTMMFVNSSVLLEARMGSSSGAAWAGSVIGFSFFSATRNLSTEYYLYKGSTAFSATSVVDSQPLDTLPTHLFAVNTGGSPSLYGDFTISGAWQTSQALTVAETETLSIAFAALQTTRGTL